jgi:hypothetical protein
VGAFVAPLFKSPHDIIEPSPTDNGYIKIYSNERAFAALKADGSITTWGNSGSGGINAPTDKGYTKIYSSVRAAKARAFE